MTRTEYWQECIAQAAEEAGVSLTEDQLTVIAEAAESGHDNFGLAFYEPPSGDRVADIREAYEKRLQVLQCAHDRYVVESERATKAVMHVGPGYEIQLREGRWEWC